jgi:hypothetical protein
MSSNFFDKQTKHYANRTVSATTTPTGSRLFDKEQLNYSHVIQHSPSHLCCQLLHKDISPITSHALLSVPSLFLINKTLNHYYVKRFTVQPRKWLLNSNVPICSLECC